MLRKQIAIELMKHLCTCPEHGYSQYARWGNGKGFCDVKIENKVYKLAKGDRDCSSAVIDAYETAGIPVKTQGASYTGNMKHVFVNSGSFKWHPASEGYVLKPGDVLLNHAHHTAMYIGNGQIAQFSISELGKIYGASGDQTGKESNIKPYYNYPWDGALECINTEDVDIGDKPKGPTPEERFITDCYASLLLRNATENEIKNWATYLNTSDPISVYMDIAYSTEGISSWVNVMYESILDRKPDADGVKYWVDKMQKEKMNRADVLAAIMSSKEYQDKHTIIKKIPVKQ